MAPRLLFYVQHLLGIGHVRRAAVLARALGRAGFDVWLAQGGFPVPGCDFGPARVVPLPPVRAADSQFKQLLTETGLPPDPAWHERRQRHLLALLEHSAPQMLLIESFPFGRRAFRGELLALLEAAATRRPRPLVACSVREILVDKGDPARHAEMVALVRRWFDLVLVHGDPALVPFAATFPAADQIAERLRYTGYVTAEDPPAAPSANGPADDRTDDLDGTGEVVVSVGGGAVGGSLLTAALAARPLTPLSQARWRLLAGPELPPAEWARLQQQAAASGGGVVVEPARADFRRLLGRCALSISQAGYNTVMDLLAAGCPAVVVPFAEGAETEQGLRARLLAERGLVQLVPAATLTPERLARAVTAALAAGRPPRPRLCLEGAPVTAELLRTALSSHMQNDR